MMIIKELHQLFLQSAGVCTDSRKVFDGCIFFALKGENFNGNKFAAQAVQAGCLRAIIDEAAYSSENCILVDNVLETLQDLARFHRNYLQTPILSITGTNGKTTTKELISSVLRKKYKLVSTQGNLNNHIGVPLSLLQMNAETELAVIEMGANHNKEIDFLCQIAQPDYGLITNIGRAHLQGFGSFETVVETKNELYQYVHTKNGELIVNQDDSLLMTLSEGTKRLTYGRLPVADIQAEFLEANPFLKFKYKSQLIETQLVGSYNFDNVLAAIAAGIRFGVSEKSIIEALVSYKPENNRSQLLKTKLNTLYLDAYNANPSSMALAIENFSQLSAGNKVLILGDMLELGKEAENEHIKIIKQLETAKFRQVYLVGTAFSKYNRNPQFQTFKTVDDLIKVLNTNKLENTHVLVKGSRGIRLEQVLNARL